MTRRSLLAGAFALLSLSAGAVAQVRQVYPGGAPAPVLADDRPIHPISDLGDFWADAARAPSYEALRQRIGNRYGRLPWAFTGAVRWGSEPDGTPRYATSTVLIRDVRRSQEDLILGTPAVLVDYEVTEPTFAHVVRTRRVEFGSR